MSLQKTDAVVLKSQKQGETSKIVTLYSKDYGILKLIAKGARGPKSRFLGSLDLLNHIGVVFYHKESRDLQLLSQADIIDPYSRIKLDLQKLSLAMVAAEMMLRSQHDHDPQPNLYHLLLAFLHKLENAKQALNVIFFWYQLRFLRWNGFRPNLKNCLACQRQLGNEQKVSFLIHKGGWLCGKCQQTTGLSMMIRRETLIILNRIDMAGLSHLEQLDMKADQLAECRLLLNKFSIYHIESLAKMKSGEFLKEVQPV